MSAHVLGDVDVLAYLEGETLHQRPRLGTAEFPPEQPAMALATRKYLRAQPASGGDAEAVRRALATAVQQPAVHQERPTLRRLSGPDDGRAKLVNELAERRRGAVYDGPEDHVESP